MSFAVFYFDEQSTILGFIHANFISYRINFTI